MKHFLLLLSTSLILLPGCSTVGGLFDGDDEDNTTMDGERISVLELQKTIEPDDASYEVDGLSIPAPWRNQFWPQVGGYPNHSMQNLALNKGELKEAWSISIGEGSTSELPLTASPIIVNNRVFTLDTDFNLSAFNTSNGEKIWKTDVKDKEEDDSVISGGIAYGGGILYVTNGYNEVLAINPKDGEILWRKSLPAPARAAPTVIEERLFVTTLDNKLIVMNAFDGTSLWDYDGIEESAGLVGAASPAANHQIVIPAFSSGELTALHVENGAITWSDNLSNLRRFGGLSSLSDINALPVIDQGIVFAISFSGKLVAIDERTGNRIWQREIGGSNTPWLAGSHLFVLSTENQLVALGRKNGKIRWITRLPRYRDKDTKDNALIWHGPILAGGRLILAGTDGIILEVEPEKGKVIREWNTGETIALPPIVADGTLYLLNKDGALTAYR